MLYIDYLYLFKLILISLVVESSLVGMMLLAHLADIHLGFAQYGYPWREDDIYRVFLEAMDKAIKEGVNIVVISGDMFDRYRPPNKALKIAIEVVKRALEKGIKIYAILGEHDIPRKSDEAPQILIPGLKLLGTSKTPLHDEVIIEGKKYLIAGISHHPSKMKYLSALKSKLTNLKHVLKQYRKSILMLHQSIKQFFAFEEGIDLNDIPDEATYVAMGHLHRRVKTRLESGGVVAYPGSLEILRVDEIDVWLKEGKGFYIVDLSSDEPYVHVINVNVRPQLRITTRYPNHVLAVRSAVSKLRSLGLGKTWDKGILHVDLEIEASKKNLSKNVIDELINITGQNIYVRPKLRIIKESKEGLERISHENISEIDIVKEFISSTLGIKDEHISKDLAEAIIKIKNILANLESGDINEYINELFKYESIWRSKVGVLEPLRVEKLPLSTGAPAMPSKELSKSESKSRKSLRKGEGLLRFLGDS